jgi:hypothetical protein
MTMEGAAPVPTLYVIVFSNFEGFCRETERAREIVDGFGELHAAFPAAIWTHMFNSIHLVGPEEHQRAGRELTAYLRSLLVGEPRTEVGLHLHAFYALIQALGVTPRGHPHAGAAPGDCGRSRGLEGDGYDVLLTAYPAAERERVIQGCLDAFATAGIPRPTSFCAGYSAADPELQTTLERLGFTTSFAAQVVPKGIEGVSYPGCWYELLEWGEKLTPLSRPYRVRRRTLLPKAGEPLLDRLVEVPLNLDTDVRPLFLHGNPVSRRAILDFHAELVLATGKSSCVCLGLHDVYLSDQKRRQPVLDEMASNLKYVQGIALRGGVPVRFATASEVSALVHANPEAW